MRNVLFLISGGLPFTAFARGLFYLLQVCLLRDSKECFEENLHSPREARHLHILAFIMFLTFDAPG